MLVRHACASAFMQAVDGGCVCESTCRIFGLRPRLNAVCMPMQVSVETALAVQTSNKGHGTVALMNACSKWTSCWQRLGLRCAQTPLWGHPCFEASAAARNSG